MDMLPCLVASSDAEDKRAVDDLRAKGSSAIREALKQTGTSGKAAKP
jgi:hypothetical protein